MFRIRLFALVFVLLMLPACATSELGRFAQVQDVYIASVTTLTDGYVAGVFTPALWQDTLLPLIDAGDAVLDEYEDAVVTGAVDPKSFIQRLQTVLDKMQPYIIRALADN